MNKSMMHPWIVSLHPHMGNPHCLVCLSAVQACPSAAPVSALFSFF